MVKPLVRSNFIDNNADKKWIKGSWKTNSPRKVNLLVWLVHFGSLNAGDGLKIKYPELNLSPCSLCFSAA